MWVRSEHAGALAVLSAWLGALVPWNLSVVSGVAGGNALFVRFPLLEVRYAFGLPVARATLLLDPLSALALQRGTRVAVGYRAWLVGAGFVVAALALSVVYYRREAAVEAGPVDPVRLMGVLLLGAGLSFAAASYLIAVRGLPAVPVPVGTLLLLVLGGVLVTVERAEIDEPAPAD